MAGEGRRGRGAGRRLELAAVGDGDLCAGLAAVAAVALHLLDDVHALHDLTEDHMLPVQPERTENNQHSTIRSFMQSLFNWKVQKFKPVKRP